jgi:hypothetical protein
MAVFGEKLLLPEPFGFELDTTELARHRRVARKVHDRGER